MLLNTLKFSIAFAVCFSCLRSDNFFSEEKNIKVNISDDEMNSNNVKIKQIKKFTRKLPFRTAKITKRFLSQKNHYVKNSKEKKVTTNYVINVQEIKSDSGIKIRFIPKTDSKVVSVKAAFLNRGDVFENIPGIAILLAKTISSGDTKKYPHSKIIQMSAKTGFNCHLHGDGQVFSINFNYILDYQDTIIDLMKEILYNSKLNTFALEKSYLMDLYKNTIKEPKDKLQIRMSAAMFPNHPYGETTTDADYEKINASMVQDAYETSFSKDNLIVVVVGNFKSTADVAKLVDNIFGNFPKTSESEFFTRDVKRVTSEKFSIIKTPNPCNDLTSNIFYVLNNAPEFKSDESVALHVANAAFAGIPLESRLINSLRKKLGKVYYARLNVKHQKFSDYFYGSTESSDYEATKTAIIETMNDFQKTGLTKEEFEDAKKYILSSHVFDIVDGSGIANLVMYFWTFGFDKDFVNSYYDKIRNTTLEEVNAVVRKYFDTNNLSFGVVTREESAKK